MVTMVITMVTIGERRPRRRGGSARRKSAGMGRREEKRPRRKGQFARRRKEKPKRMKQKKNEG